jgi:hypothetical protein
MTLEQLDDAKNQLDDMNDKMDDIKVSFKDKCDNAVVPLDNLKERSEFILIQNKNNPIEYKFIRGIKSYNESRLKRVFNGDYNLVKREFDANPITLFKTLKIIVKEDNDKLMKSFSKMSMFQKKIEYSKVETIRITGITITLFNNFSQSDLISLLERVYNEKYDSYNDVC